MSQEKKSYGMGRIVGGSALGALLALVSPMVLIGEVFSLMPMILFSSVALLALYRWAGRGVALFSAVMMVTFGAFFSGIGFALILLFLVVLPPLLLPHWQDRPFFVQLRFSIIAFGVGAVASVAVLYISFGGNMIARLFSEIPAMVRALPEEYLTPMLQSMSTLMGRSVSTTDFYELYDSMIEGLIPVYQLHLPQYLFSGVLITALWCVWLSNRKRAQRGEAAPGTYVPLAGWALPASTTGGVLLMFIAGWLLNLFHVSGAETAFYAVYGIATVAFGVQTLGSASRRMGMTRLRPGTRHVLLVLIAVLGFLWLPDALLIYGVASAIFGTRGVIQQRRQNRENDNRSGGNDIGGNRE